MPTTGLNGIAGFIETATPLQLMRVLEELEEDDIAKLISCVSFEFEGRPNLRLAAALAELMTAEQAQALYRFVVKVTKLY